MSPGGARRPPVPPGRWPRDEARARRPLLGAAGACAACALIYELALVALGGVLVGSSVTQTSLVVSLFVFALGLGALAAKPLLSRPLGAFVVIETGVAVAGGFSVLVCCAAFAYAGDLHAGGGADVARSQDALVGAELPLLMELLQRVRRQAAARAVADLTAADYIGARWSAGWPFPFALLPLLGQLRGALAAGLLNLVCAAVIVLVVFRGDLSRRRRTGAIAVLTLGAVVGRGRPRLRGPVRGLGPPAALRRPRSWSASARLPGDRHHRERDLLGHPGRAAVPQRRPAAVEPRRVPATTRRSSTSAIGAAAAGAGPGTPARGPRRVLVLGGGDGMAVREILRHPGVERVQLVDLDPAMTRLARHDPRLRRLNHEALDDRRVTVTNADAFTWIRKLDAGADARSWDVIVLDFPDPDDQGLARLHSAELYGTVRTRALAPGGVMVCAVGLAVLRARRVLVGRSHARAGRLARASLPTSTCRPSATGASGWRPRPRSAWSPAADPRRRAPRTALPDPRRAAGGGHLRLPDRDVRDVRPTTLDPARDPRLHAKGGWAEHTAVRAGRWVRRRATGARWRPAVGVVARREGGGAIGLHWRPRTGLGGRGRRRDGTRPVPNRLVVAGRGARSDHWRPESAGDRRAWRDRTTGVPNRLVIARAWQRSDHWRPELALVISGRGAIGPLASRIGWWSRGAARSDDRRRSGVGFPLRSRGWRHLTSLGGQR